MVKAGSADPLYRGGEHSDTSRRKVEELIVERLELDNVKILEGVFPDETFVEEQTGLPDRLLFHNLNGHAIIVKTSEPGAGPSRDPGQ